MLGFCRLPTLFTLRNFQDVTIEILFKSSLQSSCWVANKTESTWAASSASTINISDVTLTYDCCRMSADYLAIMDNELKSPAGSGVSYPIDTYQVQNAQLSTGSGGTTAGTGIGPLTRIVVNKGTRFLKSVYGVSKQQAGESSTLWRNNSSSGNLGFNSYQVVINSRRYPQLQIQSSAQAFQELQKAYNKLASIDGGSVVNWNNYIGQPFPRGVNVAFPQRQDYAVPGTKDGTWLGTCASDEAMFQVGVNLEQFLQNKPDAGGINTASSGYQIAVEVQQNAVAFTPNATPANLGTLTASNVSHYVILHFTRVLVLKAGALEILD